MCVVLVAICPTGICENQFFICIDLEHRFVEAFVLSRNPQGRLVPDASGTSRRGISKLSIRSPRFSILLQAGSFENLFPERSGDSFAKSLPYTPLTRRAHFSLGNKKAADDAKEDDGCHQQCPEGIYKRSGNGFGAATRMLGVIFFARNPPCHSHHTST